MTKEQLYAIWTLLPELKSDLESVIAYEIAKAKGEDKPAPNPITEAYERGEKIRYKRFWQKNEWIKKYNDTHGIDENGRIIRTQEWTFWDNIKDWEIYTEAEAEQVTEPAKPKFDKDRFESMFRAVVASGKYSGDEFSTTNFFLKQLDAFYASKEKGGELTKEYLQQFDAYVGDKGGNNE